MDSQISNALLPNWVSPRSPFRPGTLTWQARLGVRSGLVLEGLESISASTQENAAGTEEVSANSEEVLETTDEFTQHVADLHQIAEQLNEQANRFKI
ncbi:methyl-accepting chemotaxis protein, HAMP-domain protein [Ligilactobacillus ruminis]|nr:methyl-accepting chemotaxis protein, HAMP-domain protein [Ligilactobacillus ruminis]